MMPNYWWRCPDCGYGTNIIAVAKAHNCKPRKAHELADQLEHCHKIDAGTAKELVNKQRRERRPLGLSGRQWVKLRKRQSREARKVKPSFTSANDLIVVTQEETGA